MGKPPNERHRTFHSKGSCKLQQSVSLWTITNYGEVRCAGSQKLRRPAQGEIASLKRDKASHKKQLELPVTRGRRRPSLLEEGGIDADLRRNEKKPFPMHTELCVRV